VTIHLRHNTVRASTMGEYRHDQAALTFRDEAARYCGCGARLRSTNRARICDPCDYTARVKLAAEDLKRIEWYERHGA